MDLPSYMTGSGHSEIYDPPRIFIVRDYQAPINIRYVESVRDRITVTENVNYNYVPVDNSIVAEGRMHSEPIARYTVKARIRFE